MSDALFSTGGRVVRSYLLGVCVMACALGFNLFSIQDASAVSQRTVSKVEITSSYQDDEEYYKKGDEIEVTVTFSGSIHVGSFNSHTPHARTQAYIDLKIGEKTRRASNDGTPNAYAEGNKTMKFTYRVKEGDYDSDGIEVVANSLNDGDREIYGIGSCSERGCSFGTVNLNHAAQGPFSSHKVRADGALELALYPSQVSDSDSNTISGRLQMFDAEEGDDGEWRWVCDDNFGEDEAKVACNQMGYKTDDAAVWAMPEGWLTVQSTGLAAFAEAVVIAYLTASSAVLDEVDCPVQQSCQDPYLMRDCTRTYQSTLLQCDHDGRGVSDCTVSEAVGVTCKE